MLYRFTGHIIRSVDSDNTDPILRASVLSTGTVRIRPEHASRTNAPLPWWLLTSRRWTEPLPINVYVIEHSAGLVLFDTGQDRRSVTDPSYFPPGLLGWTFGRLATFSIGSDETLPQLLRAAGYDPDRVTHLVISHLHQDHIGGIGDFPQAQVLVSVAEWQEHARPGAVLNGYLGRHIDLPGTRWHHVDFTAADGVAVGGFDRTVDLFGDGSLLLIPTPGHTPGSLSLLMQRPAHPPVLMVGDLTYDAAHFDQDHVPGVGKRSVLRETTDRVNHLREELPHLVIAAAHDPSAADAFRSAMAETP